MLKDKMWRARDKREARAPSSSKHIQTHFLPILATYFFTYQLHLSNVSSHSFLTFFLLFCPPLLPLTLQSLAFSCQWDQATARCTSMKKNGWLIQSSLLFLRQCRVIRGTAKAFWCIAFMFSLASPPQQKSKFYGWGWGGFAESLETRESLFQQRDTWQWVPSPQGSCCHSSEKARVS